MDFFTQIDRDLKRDKALLGQDPQFEKLMAELMESHLGKTYQEQLAMAKEAGRIGSFPHSIAVLAVLGDNHHELVLGAAAYDLRCHRGALVDIYLESDDNFVSRVVAATREGGLYAPFTLMANSTELAKELIVQHFDEKGIDGLEESWIVEEVRARQAAATIRTHRSGDLLLTHTGADGLLHLADTKEGTEIITVLEHITDAIDRYKGGIAVKIVGRECKSPHIEPGKTIARLLRPQMPEATLIGHIADLRRLVLAVHADRCIELAARSSSYSVATEAIEEATRILEEVNNENDGQSSERTTGQEGWLAMETVPKDGTEILLAIEVNWEGEQVDPRIGSGRFVAAFWFDAKGNVWRNRLDQWLDADRPSRWRPLHP